LNYDVVVAGAGTAGLFAAYRLAKAGLKVALVDMKPEDKVGEKVCGDAIGKHHFDNLRLSYPSGDELDGKFKGVIIYSPDEKHSITVKGEGFAVNRYKFGRRLLRMAVDAGAELFAEHHVTAPIIEGGKVVGVKAINLAENAKREFRGLVTVDASGVGGVVRTKLPSDWWITEKLDGEDTSVCYREILETQVEFDDTYAVIYLSRRIAPGGYWWFFPKKKNLVNVGLGVQPIEGAPNPINQYRQFIKSREELKNAKVVHAGGGVVPTRRFIHCPVANGVLAIGDAAFTCNPIHGGGIGSSMVSAKCAAETIINALENYGEASLETLWSYSLCYIKKYGAKQAKLDIFRVFLQKLPDEDLNFAFRKGVITGDEVYAIGMSGDLKLSVEEKVSRALKLISRPTLLYKLKLVRDYMDKVKKMYQKYPESPSGFPKWNKKVYGLFEEFKKKIA